MPFVRPTSKFYNPAFDSYYGFEPFNFDAWNAQSDPVAFMQAMTAWESKHGGAGLAADAAFAKALNDWNKAHPDDLAGAANWSKVFPSGNPVEFLNLQRAEYEQRLEAGILPQALRNSDISSQSAAFQAAARAVPVHEPFYDSISKKWYPAAPVIAPVATAGPAPVPVTAPTNLGPGQISIGGMGVAQGPAVASVGGTGASAEAIADAVALKLTGYILVPGLQGWEWKPKS